MTLNDLEIATEIKAGRLIKNVDLNLLVGACCELRMGSVYYDLTEGAKRFALKSGQAVLIKPGHRVVLITEESLNIPPDILVRIVSKGSLFSVGLTPVATYADPGFSGNLGIVTQNISDKFIELPRGEPIAKADFTRLSSGAKRLYNGQHGFQSGIWPVKTHLQKEYSEVSKDPRVKSELQEALDLLPLPTRTAIRRLETTQLWTLAALIGMFIVNVASIFLISGSVIDQIYGVAGNLVASGILAVVAITINIVRRIK